VRILVLQLSDRSDLFGSRSCLSSVPAYEQKLPNPFFISCCSVKVFSLASFFYCSAVLILVRVQLLPDFCFRVSIRVAQQSAHAWDEGVGPICPCFQFSFPAAVLFSCCSGVRLLAPKDFSAAPIFPSADLSFSPWC
jgi:hypothetical protein